MEDESNKVETHKPYIWWAMRIMEMITCLHIIANTWRHW